MITSTPRTFVLVHGAWHGGWCWGPVASILRGRGHIVFTPTQTGLAERAHLLSTSVTLSVFVHDVVNLLTGEDLSDVVLVGHSFGGISISGAADKIPERISTLVYLDSLIVDNGETALQQFPAEAMRARLEAAHRSSSGLSLPVPSAATFGIDDPAQRKFVADRLTPHPLTTYTSTLSLEHPLGNGLPATYVMCTNPCYKPLAGSRQRVRDWDWPIVELATGHDAMVTAPAVTAALLEELSKNGRRN